MSRTVHSCPGAPTRAGAHLCREGKAVLNLADHTPDTTPPICSVCLFAADLDPTNAATFADWIAAIKDGHLRRSQVRAAVHAAGGPDLSETAFGRHMRNHT